MGILDRVILSIYTVFLLAVSLVTVLIAAGWLTPLQFLEAGLRSTSGRWAIGLVGAVFFIVSLRLLWYAFRRRGTSQTTIHETALGEVRISLNAIENLIRRVGRQVNGIRDLHPRVRAAEGGLKIDLRAWVSPDINVPDVSDHLQGQVKKHIRNVVGMDVAEISILVKDVSTEIRRGRVE